MRVIAGTARGRRIRAPDGRSVRPTPARVREALFSILKPRVEGSRVLDLYCGSGSLGLEALSQGAIEVTFVDRSRVCLDIVRRNLEELGFASQARLLGRSCPGQIDATLPGPFDIILADPPYDDHPLVGICDRLAAHALLAEGGILVYEGAAKGARALAERMVPGWVEVERRAYGDTGLWFFERSG